MQLEAGDFVLLYTDGVTEAVSGADENEFYGEQRLRELLCAQRASSSRDVLQVLIDRLGEFIDPHPPNDDITMVGIKRVP